MDSIKLEDNFFDLAIKMREHFLRVFENPLLANEQRFGWDHWYVPGQYHLHRSHAHLFFPKELYEAFETKLCEWGQDQLGCTEISSPWVSYYSHGCEQKLHADNPHGPWAFVFSLTDWQNRSFSGGETEVLSEHVLDYWSHADFAKGLEAPQLFDRIEPLFNRLTVFDPRRPHGVNRVQGSDDPRNARLVVHGWFLPPSPFVSGGLEDQELSETLGPALNLALDEIEAQGKYNGYVLFRVHVDSTGEVMEVKEVTSTLRAVETQSLAAENVMQRLSQAFYSMRFPEAPESSELSFPLVFQ